MIDREKIIDGLEKEAMACGDYIQLPLWVYSSVIAVLKEQKAVVRCKDCAKQCTDNCLLYWNDINTPDNWYCADGVKRE